MNRISVFYEHMAEAMKQENITLDEVCAAVKRFGFDGVELDANRIKNEGDVILPALQKAGLCVNGIYNFFDFGSETGSPENDRAESLRVIDCCEKANCKFLLAVAGFLTEDEMVRGRPHELIGAGVRRRKVIEFLHDNRDAVLFRFRCKLR